MAAGIVPTGTSERNSPLRKFHTTHSRVVATILLGLPLLGALLFQRDNLRVGYLPDLPSILIDAALAILLVRSCRQGLVIRADGSLVYRGVLVTRRYDRNVKAVISGDYWGPLESVGGVLFRSVELLLIDGRRRPLSGLSGRSNHINKLADTIDEHLQKQR